MTVLSTLLYQRQYPNIMHSVWSFMQEGYTYHNEQAAASCSDEVGMILLLDSGTMRHSEPLQ